MATGLMWFEKKHNRCCKQHSITMQSTISMCKFTTAQHTTMIMHQTHIVKIYYWRGHESISAVNYVSGHIRFMSHLCHTPALLEVFFFLNTIPVLVYLLSQTTYTDKIVREENAELNMVRVRSINKQICCCYKEGLQHCLILRMMLPLCDLNFHHF